MPVTQGADFSWCQTGCNYPELRSAGVQFAWLKLCDWSPKNGFFIDSMHDTHSKGLRAAGVFTSDYAFGHVTPDPIQFADFFAARCSVDQIPPCLDMETMSNRQIPANAGAWALAFLQHLEQTIGITPILYASTGYLKVIGQQAPGLGHFPIWCAEYRIPPNPDNIPRLPAPFMQEKLVGVQWTGNGKLPGCPGPIDRDVLVWPLDQLLIEVPSSSPSSSTSVDTASGS